MYVRDCVHVCVCVCVHVYVCRFVCICVRQMEGRCGWVGLKYTLSKYLLRTRLNTYVQYELEHIPEGGYGGFVYSYL